MIEADDNEMKNSPKSITEVEIEAATEAEANDEDDDELRHDKEELPADEKMDCRARIADHDGKIVSSFRIAFRGIMREVSSLDLTRPKTLNCKEWANYVNRVVRCFGESLGNLKFGEFTVHYNRLQDKSNRKLFIQVMKDQLYIRLTRFKPNLIPYLSVKKECTST
ncbi:unnamed protein product [Candida parapsilosis]